MVLGVASIVLYAAATVSVGSRLRPHQHSKLASKRGLMCAATLALCLHGAVLYVSVNSAAGINLGFSNTASLVAWVTTLVVLAVTVSKPLENLGIFVFPLAGISVLLTLLYPSHRVLPHGAGFGVQAHIVTSVLAYGLLTIAAFQAILLAYQEHRLRSKRPGAVVRLLPPLQVQESLLFQLIWTGFFLLTLSLMSGIMFVDDLFAQHLVHKTVLSICAWLVFALLLWGRWRFGWRGRTVIRWSLCGFLTLMLAYFGSKLVLELILGRQWYSS